MGRIVTFTSDFGRRDTYAGQMKGAALAVCPDIVPVNLCHDVPAHDVAAGSWLLETGFASFPHGTIHVAVVDPGVGTTRAALVVETAHYVFVAPDNGLLTRALALDPPRRVHAIDPARLGSGGRAPSPTFHGRDLFAPAAAWIARGSDVAELGPPARALVRLPLPDFELATGRPIEVPVVFVDHFGNVVLDVRIAPIERVLGGAPLAGRVRIDAASASVTAVARTYGDGPPGSPFLLANSAGYLELAWAGGRAADALGLAAGSRVRLTLG